MWRLPLLAATAFAVSGCSSVATRPTDGGPEIEVFASGAPERPFQKLSELTVYVDGITLMGSVTPIEAALPRLKRQAREAKADAIIDLQARVRGSGEATIYKVTATAVVYVEPAPPEAAPAPAAAESPAAPAPPSAGGQAAATPSPGAAPAGIDDRDVEVFTSGVPQRPFRKVRELDVYAERKTSLAAALDEALPFLKRQARLAGADAIIDIRGSMRGAGEAAVYHVTATAVAYTAATPPQ